MSPRPHENVRMRALVLGFLVCAIIGYCLLLAPSEAQANAATTNWSCPSGGTLSGSTCTRSQGAYYASGYYYCPSGGTLSGSTCSTSSSYPAKRVWGSCPSGTYTSYYIGECWQRTSTSKPCASGSYWSAAGSSTYNDGYWTYGYSWPSGCYNGGGPLRSSTWSCPYGGSLSTSTYGTSGTCTTSSSYSASWSSGYYYCSSGWSLSGSTCYYSYSASYYYSCPSGGVLSGSRCLPTTVAVRDGTGADAAYDSSAPLDANWTAATGGTISTYAWCFTTSSCVTGSIASGSSPAATRAAASGAAVVSNGVRYYACVRAVDSTGDYGAWSCSNGAIFDAVAPDPVTTLAAVSPTLVSPELTWSTVVDVTSGVNFYRVYRGASGAGPWTQINVDGVTTTGSYTDATAPWGTSYYKVQAVDNATNEAAASNVVSVLYHRAPSTTLVTPANGATGVVTTPTLTATHNDADADMGQILFQVCSDAACTGVVASGSSAAGIAAGANGSWVVSSALAQATTYYWRARSTDINGAVGSWTATWSFTTSSLPTISVGLSTLGYVDAARGTASPYGMDMGLLTLGSTSQVGPSGSGQTLAGAAVQVNITSNTIAIIQVSATPMTDGTNTIPYANTRVKPSASVIWSALSAVSTDIETSLAPGTFTRNFDYELTIPRAQPAGSYSQSVTWTVLAQP